MKHEEQADRLEREADHLEKHSETVGDHIQEAREDFEGKAESSDVPGAQAEEDRVAGLDTSYDEEEGPDEPGEA